MKKLQFFTKQRRFQKVLLHLAGVSVEVFSLKFCSNVS